MKIRIRATYNCEYCNKLYLIRGACERHELGCYRNPDNKRPCFDCKYLVKEEAEVFLGYDHWSGEPVTGKAMLMKCSALNKFIYAPHTEIKGNAFEVVDFNNEPMPRECDLFDGDLLADLFD